MKTIAIANQKGGVGKSTTVLELGTILASKPFEKKVLIIDTDQQKNLSTYAGADLTKPTLYNLLHSECTISDAIQHLNSFDFIAASSELSKADREFVDQDDVFLIADLVELLKDYYDYVLIDNSPSRNILLTMTYIAADYCILPSEADQGSIHGIGAVYQDIEKLRTGRMKLSKCHILGLILTKYENTIMHQKALETLNSLAEAMPDDDPFVDYVRKAIVVSECKQTNQSLQQYAAYSNPSLDYKRIAKKIVDLSERE